MHPLFLEASTHEEQTSLLSSQRIEKRSFLKMLEESRALSAPPSPKADEDRDRAILDRFVVVEVFVFVQIFVFVFLFVFC